MGNDEVPPKDSSRAFRLDERRAQASEGFSTLGPPRSPRRSEIAGAEAVGITFGVTGLSAGRAGWNRRHRRTGDHPTDSPPHLDIPAAVRYQNLVMRGVSWVRRPGWMAAVGGPVVGFLVLALGLEGFSAVFRVDSADDAGPGSLRQAIQESNAAGGGTISMVGFSGTITLQSALPEVSANVLILGPGTNALTISGAGQFRVFSFGPRTTNLVEELTIADGWVTNREVGAGVRNRGSLTLRGCLVVGNTCRGGSGGGIQSSGDLALESCAVINNRVEGSAAPYSGRAESAMGGGVAVNGGIASLIDSTVMGNSVLGGSGADSGTPGLAEGGGLHAVDARLSLVRTRVASNGAQGGQGGWGGVVGTARSGATAAGGALSVQGGVLEMTHCVLTENTVRGGVGGSARHGALAGGRPWVAASSLGAAPSDWGT